MLAMLQKRNQPPSAGLHTTDSNCIEMPIKMQFSQKKPPLLVAFTLPSIGVHKLYFKIARSSVPPLGHSVIMEAENRKWGFLVRRSLHERAI